MERWTNAAIAQQLEHMAELLEAQQANPFRVRAYRNAATVLQTLPRPAVDILRKEGIDGLKRLPAIGESLSRAIGQLVDTGTINLLEQLRGALSPELVLSSIAGIGPRLAERIHDQLDIETLFELQHAAYDGRLASVPGFGARRLRAVRDALAGRFQRDRPYFPAQRPSWRDQPTVKELLDVDREYRVKSSELPHIAPSRYNPTGAAWLPILHTQRGQNHYTALYSNSAHAHEMGAVRDWLVIYRDDEQGAGQWTVITAHFGRLCGMRIVRGREAECEQLLAATMAHGPG